MGRFIGTVDASARMIELRLGGRWIGLTPSEWKILQDGIRAADGACPVHTSPEDRQRVFAFFSVLERYVPALDSLSDDDLQTFFEELAEAVDRGEALVTIRKCLDLGLLVETRPGKFSVTKKGNRDKGIVTQRRSGRRFLVLGKNAEFVIPLGASFRLATPIERR